MLKGWIFINFMSGGCMSQEQIIILEQWLPSLLALDKDDEEKMRRISDALKLLRLGVIKPNSVYN